MDTAPHEELGTDDASQVSLWREAERQFEEVQRGVRLLDYDVEHATAPLLRSLRTLSHQHLNGKERGQLGRLLARVLGTMLYAPELAAETEVLGRELLQRNEEAEDPEVLLSLHAALTVLYSQTGTLKDGQSARIANVLQSLTAALDTAAGSAAGTKADDTFFLLLAGCLHYASGRFDRTLELYERYGYRVSQDFPLWHNLFCMQTSLAALYCNRFPMSLGIIESFRSTAELTGSSRQSLFWRVHLSFLLLRMGRLQEALPHIDHVLTVAAGAGIRQICSVGNRALALYHYKNNNPAAAARLLAADGKERRPQRHFVLLVTDPVVLEMLFDLQIRQGFSIPGYEIEQELQRLEQGPNSFLRGVGLCLRGRLTAVVAAEIRGILRGDPSQARRGGTLRVAARTERDSRAECMPPLFSDGLRAVLDDATRAAETSASVLILGETGVGKEILARYIHEQSGCSGPFVPVQLACISEHLFESELFGHEKGAFTGAVRAKTGLVELARNGVLFLDEIGDIPLHFQVKLLRLLQEREFMRVGGVQTIRTYFRLITATNRNLRADVRQGRFREDLYHRLAVIPLHIPPLRERKNDILPLAHAFRRHYAELHRRSGNFPTDAQLATLTDGQWMGNVRELQGVVERAVVLERYEYSEGCCRETDGSSSIETTPPHAEPMSLTGSMKTFPTAEGLLQSYIRLVLEKTGGKIYGADGAVAILGMAKSTLYARMKKMGI